MDGNRIMRELFALFLVFWGALLLLCLVTFSSQDPGLNHVVSSPQNIHNGAGLFGAYLSGILVDFFGVASYLWPLGFLLAGGRNFIRELTAMWWRWVGIILLGISLCSMGAAVPLDFGNIEGGGFLGRVLHKLGTYYLHPVGGGLLWTFVTLIAVQLTLGGTWEGLVRRLKNMLAAAAHSFTVRKERNKALALKAGAGEHDALDAPDASDAQRAQEAEARAQAREERRIRREAKKAQKNSRSLLQFFTGKKETAKNPLALAPDHEQEETDDTGLRIVSEPAFDDDFTYEDDPAAGPVTVLGTDRPLPGEAEEVGGQYAGSVGQPVPQQSSGIIIDERVENAEGEDILDSFAPAANPSAKKRVAPPPKVKAKLPKLDILTDHTSTIQKTPREVLEAKGSVLMECLTDFGIKGELQRITPGPVVTMFEIKPAPGVKVSKIANLADDLAMALMAMSVRIQAPIPGRDTVGVEIPNDMREMVCLRELFASKAFQKSEEPLTLAIGKDIAGVPSVTDLAKMPHLLVAGATGQGKSVFINSVLMSLLYRTRPDSLQLLLIDPKRIELAVYSDLPHLVHPVVTDMSQAKNALDWAVHEMDRRYENIAKLGVRNIQGYNDKLHNMGSDRPDNLADLEPMPYLVIIIDELADLMLTAAKEVETSIVRLAQLARAAGIHLILATQRPSVDVVTGLIKANFPCRISFQVTAKHDSRTILDTVGAEMLLGKGDMLFKLGGSKLQRMHGAFVSDDDVCAVVDFWKKQIPPSYNVDFAEWGNEGTGDLSGMAGGANGIPDDPVYQEAVAFVLEQGKASISLIQRRFRIGFNRAARYVEQMEQDGIIGPADGSKPRAVLGGPIAD